jgi:hypothetical protein
LNGSASATVIPPRLVLYELHLYSRSPAQLDSVDSTSDNTVNVDFSTDNTEAMIIWLVDFSSAPLAKCLFMQGDMGAIGVNLSVTESFAPLK